MRKAQGGLNAAVLVAIIGGLIILYILFLPAEEREELLQNESNGNGFNDDDDDELLLRVFPDSLDDVDEIENQQVPNVFLFETTNAKTLDRINPFFVRNGWFNEKAKTATFTIEDLENADDIVLSFKATKHEGILTIMLNNNVIFEQDLRSQNVDPISLKKSLLNRQNTLEFSASPVGLKFWKTNEYNLEDIKIIGDITDKSKQESRNVFTLTPEELDAVERAFLRFVPYCGAVENVGTLDVSINGRNVFSAVPVCEDPYKQEIPPSILREGENRVIFKTNKGSYSVEQIEVDFEEEETETNVYFFEINETQFNEIEDDDADAILRMEFVEEDKTKRGDVNINDRFFSLEDEIDDDERAFSKNINDFVKEGNNFIEIRPRNRLNIVEIEIRLED